MACSVSENSGGSSFSEAENDTDYWERRAALPMRAVYEGSDMFVWLPTGYGKSLCYQALPFLMDYKKGLVESGKSCGVLVVSALIALMHVYAGVFTQTPNPFANVTIKESVVIDREMNLYKRRVKEALYILTSTRTRVSLSALSGMVLYTNYPGISTFSLIVSLFIFLFYIIVSYFPF